MIVAMRVRALTTLLTLIALGGVAAGCGDDDDEGGASLRTPSSPQEQEIATLVRSWAEEDDSPRTCREVYTSSLVKAIYLSQAGCLKRVAEPDDDDSQIKDTEVGDVTIQGDKASTRLRGNLSDESIGTLQVDGTILLEKERGKFRITGYDDEFLKGILAGAAALGFEQSVREEKVPDADKLLEDANLAECGEQGLQGLGSVKLQTLGFQVFGRRDKEATEQQLADLLFTCLGSSDGGRKLVRASFENDLFDDVPPAKADCLKEKLRPAISDELLLKAVREGAAGDEDGASLQQVGRIAQQVAAQCPG